VTMSLGFWRTIPLATLTLIIAGHESVRALGTALQSPPSNLPSPSGQSPVTYEDNEVKVVVPADWDQITLPKTADDPAFRRIPARLWVRLPPAKTGLVLASGRYTLVLNFQSGHASGVEGGRFIEAFNIPWIEDGADVWACGGYLRQFPQPVNRELIFINYWLKGQTPEGRPVCGVPEELDKRRGMAARPWLAGYFTTAEGSWFFHSDGAGCPMRTYTLTTDAETPQELPDALDPTLQRVIAEAIRIVDSIQYKRCPPARFPRGETE